MAEEKRYLELFHTDRWERSDGALLPIEARGLYRAMLTAAWRRGGRLPNDPVEIRRAVGCTVEEWGRAWPRVERFWRVEGEALVPVEDLGECRLLPGQTGHRPHIPLAVRRAVFERDACTCVVCGATEALQLDHHPIPFSRGGPDTAENLRVLCGPCNVARGAR